MYRKLCKYEFKSIGRTLLPIYLAVIAVSVINLISMKVTNDALLSTGNSLLGNIFGLFQAVAAFAYFGVMVALFVLTAVVIIQRFYKGLLCDEGYLMFTLPVKTWHLLASKATTALVMSVLSALTAMVSIFILTLGMANYPLELVLSFFAFDKWALVFRSLTEFTPTWPLYVLESLLLAVAYGLSFLFHIYLALALGHLAKKHRIMMAVVAYIAISLIVSFLTGMLMLVIGSPTLGLDTWLAYTLTPQGGLHLVFCGLLAYQLVQLAVYFFGTERILSKKLNLE